MTKLNNLPFFGAHASVAEFTDPNLPEDAKKRLGGQNRKVLALLREGPKTNTELESVCGRVNSRIADVRRWLVRNESRTIASTPIDTQSGVYQYNIETAPKS